MHLSCGRASPILFRNPLYQCSGSKQYLDLFCNLFCSLFSYINPFQGYLTSFKFFHEVLNHGGPGKISIRSRSNFSQITCCVKSIASLFCRFCCKTSFKSEDNTKLRYVGSWELQNVFLGKTPSPLIRILVARILVVIVFFSGKDISGDSVFS